MGKFSGVACSLLFLWKFLCRKQHSNKVLPFGARASGNYASSWYFSVLDLFAGIHLFLHWSIAYGLIWLCCEIWNFGETVDKSRTFKM